MKVVNLFLIDFHFILIVFVDAVGVTFHHIRKMRCVMKHSRQLTKKERGIITYIHLLRSQVNREYFFFFFIILYFSYTIKSFPPVLYISFCLCRDNTLSCFKINIFIYILRRAVKVASLLCSIDFHFFSFFFFQKKLSSIIYWKMFILVLKNAFTVFVKFGERISWG